MGPSGVISELSSQILSASSFYGVFSALLVALITLFDFNEINPTYRPLNVPTEQLDLSVDFIIIGAGSGGKFFLT